MEHDESFTAIQPTKRVQDESLFTMCHASPNCSIVGKYFWVVYMYTKNDCGCLSFQFLLHILIVICHRYSTIVFCFSPTKFYSCSFATSVYSSLKDYIFSKKQENVSSRTNSICFVMRFISHFFILYRQNWKKPNENLYIDRDKCRTTLQSIEQTGWIHCGKIVFKNIVKSERLLYLYTE